MSCNDFNAIFEIYKSIIESSLDKFTTRKAPLKLPIIPTDVIISLFESTKVLFECEPNIIMLKSPLVIVGDVHGHLFDVLRIFNKNGLPPETVYLFLGDVVDRGEFNLEVFTLLVLLKYFFPENIYIIRGNHEAEQIVDHSSFHQEIRSLYEKSDEIIKIVNDIFANMSLAATVDGEYAICIHGGICDGFYFLDQLNEIKKPIYDLEKFPLVRNVVWSDPNTKIDGFQPSERFVGEEFGSKQLSAFMSRNKNASILIRGHQVAENGIESIFGHRLMTVFSASNYCGIHNNRAGIVKFMSDSRFETETYEPLPYIKRTEIGLLQWECFSPLKNNKLKVLNKKQAETSPIKPASKLASSSTPNLALNSPPSLTSNLVSNTASNTESNSKGGLSKLGPLPKLHLSGVVRDVGSSKSASSLNKGQNKDQNKDKARAEVCSPRSSIRTTNFMGLPRKATSARSEAVNRGFRK